MAAALVLAERSRVRYLTGAAMYFAQGIPQGLLSIALPAWLASLGVSAGQIASYLAIVYLPWAFKLLTGPLMDRFEFLPMGRRRPWVLGAQLGMTLSLLALTLVKDPAEQMGLLMLIGIIVNCFTATQDVAVDGMSIDLTPVNEQGRLNAFMTFGKAVGWGSTAAISGVMLVTFGLGVTAMAAASVAGVVFLAFALIRERAGERRLPWSAGEATAPETPEKSFKVVFGGINSVLWTRTSIVVIGIMFADGMVSGYGHALMPIAAIKLFGYTTPEWSRLVAMMGLTGAVVALGLGPFIDKFGPKRMLFLTATLVAGHAFLLAGTQQLWTDRIFVEVMLSAWVLMVPVVMVCVIALAMAICSAGFSATQFAIYMSVANLGYSSGSKIYGLVAERTTFVEDYILMGLLAIGVIVVVIFHRHRHDHAHKPAAGKKLPPRFTLGSTTAQGGIYWSGAMRCPKCRSDMELIEIEGVEIDRCATCGGLWFDAGEAEQLKDKKIAAAIDTGDARTGKEQNKITQYRCPRCGGEMVQQSDPQQRHIHYEECASCRGSFFDAGEFRDLSQLTISDFFKRLTNSGRE